MTDTTEITLPTNWADFGERVLRAFYTGAIGAASALHVFSDFSISNLADAWKPILIAGVVAALTAAKAAIFQGRGTDPSDGKRAVNGRSSNFDYCACSRHCSAGEWSSHS